MIESLKSVLESVCFVHGEPIAVSRLVKIAGASKDEVQAALVELKRDYEARGIRLIQNGEEWQFATSPENKAAVEKLFSSDFSEELGRAGLEVLAVVAYKGPVTRAAIEYIRGVNSSFALRSLLLRGLIQREENPKDRRSYIYSISTELLKHLGLSSQGALPYFAEFHAEEVKVSEAEPAA